MNDLDCANNAKKALCKTMRASTKNEESYEKLEEKFEILWSKSLRNNWVFSELFTKSFFYFWLRSESIDVSKIKPVFYNKFPDFGGGGGVPSSRPPPPDGNA